LLLTAPSGLSSAAASFLAANKATLTTIEVIGGVLAVSDAVANAAGAAA
jgi:hypothetical protein